ncbi:MAG: hypothetical protein HOB79_06170 [Rhodospirillaceae bacterium]|jgi:hypothetical protein|nr:hypothetical protein [Rhodospirillales bacterium]MBT3907233.1 hypothetical protein [Rhodospirillaceae bacterium]MBT4700645.1 hypothetical protein [Rhodospirillaceae bacterium]MBT5036189.1 hypothetical protein [Rhodospirillaceae bacterium]MBT6218606.1 hypothetical protein [Rhodospirillaceae bacterium]
MKRTILYALSVVALGGCDPISEPEVIKKSPSGITLIGAKDNWRQMMADQSLAAKAREHCYIYNKKAVLIETPDFTTTFECR